MTEKVLRVDNREVFKELTAEAFEELTSEAPVTEEEKGKVLAYLKIYAEQSWPGDPQPLNSGGKR